MIADGHLPLEPQSDSSPRHELAASGSDTLLRESLLLAGATTGAMAALILKDEAGTWHRDSSGLTTQQLADLECVLSQGPDHKPETHLMQHHGLRILESLPLAGDRTRVSGTLCLVSPVPLTLTESQRAGLRLLAGHIRTIVSLGHGRTGVRAEPGASSLAAFVPGLVHELSSFIFGISASLDSLEARFAGMEQVSRYGANIRRSIDRMNDFLVDLREFGPPRNYSWTRFGLASMAQEAIEQNAAWAASHGLELRLHVEGSLPPVVGDRQGLSMTLSRLVALLLQQEPPGGHVILRVASSRLDDREAIGGDLDFSGQKMKHVDPARLFEPFYFRVSGMGRLTLPVARRVFSAHGGTLAAETRPEGGMRIHFTLPTDLSYPLRAANRP